MVRGAVDGAQGDGDSMAPSISADGRHVAFESDATHLVPGDTNRLRDVFVKDVRTGLIVRLTAQGSGAPANAKAYQPALSANGRYVAFTSEWPYPVHSGPPGRQSDVYVRDLRTGRTTKVNVGLDKGFGIVSRDSSMCADGRYVAFVAGAEPWFPLGLHGDVRVYVRDLWTGMTRRVSAAPGPGGDREGVRSAHHPGRERRRLLDGRAQGVRAARRIRLRMTTRHRASRARRRHLRRQQHHFDPFEARRHQLRRQIRPVQLGVEQDGSRCPAHRRPPARSGHGQHAHARRAG
ncbi:hypothetical protein ABT186_02850 [Streptomyces sp. NPDC001634]|uniref:TolB family protein n=1 Tax=Streptomyces sp. NPDC001634 TaxID=3154390 RepID=UPI00331CA290